MLVRNRGTYASQYSQHCYLTPAALPVRQRQTYPFCLPEHTFLNLVCQNTQYILSIIYTRDRLYVEILSVNYFITTILT